ncbi:MAG: sensor histidine kinase [Flavobacteriales bacterium]
MNKHRIQIAISLMACALLVLISVQYFWIESLYQQSVQRFDRDLRVALRNTSNELFRLQYAEHSIFLKQLMMQKQNHQQSGNHPNITAFDGGLGGFNPTIQEEKQSGISLDNQAEDQYNDMRLEMQRIFSSYLDDIFFLQGLKVESELDFNEIDSILHKELKNRGIETDFSFAVTDNQRQFIHRSSTEDAKTTYLDEGYRQVFYLLPNPHERYDIHLLIKKKFSYLVSDMRPIIAILTVMILIIAGSFYYALRIIFNQKKLSEIKTDFINNMTHELKTPISTVSLALEALLKFDLRMDEQRSKKYLEICKNENARLGNMVENVLNSAANQKGELKLNCEELELNKLVSQVVENIEVQVRAKNGSISLKLEATDDLIYADPVHFTNILFNLLDNAIKYYRDVPKIEIKTKSDSSNVYIDVKDEGIGLKKEDKERIFERFYRVPTGNVHNVKGYGLGLSYVYDVVQKHEGSILVESELGKGTNFKIKLPHGRTS